MQLLFLLIAMLFTQGEAAPWRFAVFADTQWPLESDSVSTVGNPHSVSVDFINQINGRLRTLHDIDFVVYLGDLGDAMDIESIQARATWSQELYDAGIGVFPVRGNHDDGPHSAREFSRVFPQTVDGVMNRTPADAFLWTDSNLHHPVLSPRGTFQMGNDFSSPDCAPGRSYAFEYRGVTLALIDQYMDERARYCEAKDQLDWLENVLSSRADSTPAFVVAHKPLIGACHDDNLFGDDPSADSANTTKFMHILNDNKVYAYISGHDHLLQHSLIDEPGPGGKTVEQFIFQGASWKLYPALVSPTIDEKFNVPAYGKTRETLINSETGTIGYQIFEVDGPRVEANSWAALTGITWGELKESMDLRDKFEIRHRWGWSLRGKQTVLKQNDDLSALNDVYQGTEVKILSGKWKATTKDFYRRELSALASTDWRSLAGFQSAVWTVWGLEVENGKWDTPTYTLSMTVKEGADVSDKTCLMRLEDGHWRCAGAEPLQNGPWSSTQKLGAQGYDPATKTAWAVVNRGGDFAVGYEGMTVSTMPKSIKEKSEIAEPNYDLLGRKK